MSSWHSKMWTGSGVSTVVNPNLHRSNMGRGWCFLHSQDRLDKLAVISGRSRFSRCGECQPIILATFSPKNAWGGQNDQTLPCHNYVADGKKIDWGGVCVQEWGDVTHHLVFIFCSGIFTKSRYLDQWRIQGSTRDAPHIGSISINWCSFQQKCC